MITRTIGKLTHMTEGHLYNETLQASECSFTGVSTDSRTIQPGMLFVPIVGETFNGHEFTQAAIERGASAVLWQQDQGEPPSEVPAVIVQDTLHAVQLLASAYRKELNVKVVGVTGSNGKTTTKDMIASVLSTTYKVCKTQGNLNNHLGLPLTLLQMSDATEIAVIEMGMSGQGEIDLLSSIALPDIAVITHIGEAHLLQLGSQEAIAQAKLEIISGLKEDGVLVYPGDEPIMLEAIEKLGPNVMNSKLKQVRFGLQPSNDFNPVAVMMDSNCVHFTLEHHADTPFRIPLVGRHNVNNALAAIAVGTLFHVSLERIRFGLANMESSGMRNELLQSSNGVAIINDAYNASPSSMQAALTLLAELPGYNKKIAVLGDMLELGESERDFHASLGEWLNPEQIHYVFTFGKLASHIAEAISAKYGIGRVQMFMDYVLLSAAVKQVASPGDIILIKGSRGMELERIIDQLQ